MKRKNKILVALGILLVVCVALVYFYVLPVVNVVYVEMKAYETRVAIRDDYTLYTTPLSESIVEDICLKLGIDQTSENCKKGITVYAPELFDEIKTYFNELPDEEKTYETVENILGEYLIACVPTTSDGHYSCDYDLHGDKKYPIAFFFNEDDFYFQIIANTSRGGS